MNPSKSPISGRQITRKEALKGLGYPKKWKRESDAAYAEFRAKPKLTQSGKTIAGTFVQIETVVKGKGKNQLTPVYARKAKRRATANRKRSARLRRKS